MLERLTLLIGEFRYIQCESSSYRFAGTPSTPHEIKELLLLKLRLLGGYIRTVELYEPVAFDVLLDFFKGSLQNLFQIVR